MNFARPAYLTLLELNGAFALFLGACCLLNFPASIDPFGVTYHVSMGPLSSLSGAQFLLQGALPLAAIPWTSRGNPAGVVIGAAVGIYLLFFTGLELFAGRGEIAQVADAPRGALLVVCGLAVWRSQAGEPEVPA